MRATSRTSSNLAVVGGLLAAILFWVLDLYGECNFFASGRTCAEMLFQPEPSKLWIRLLASADILLLILLATLLLRRREEAEAKLAHSSFLMEELSIELNQRNAQLEKEAARRHELEKRLALLAVTDPLTGIPNRIKFEEVLNLLLRLEVRYPRGLALLMLDVDRFKEVNDHLGPAVGDEVINDLAQLLEHNRREADDLFRTRGEQFCLITFSAGDTELATAADKIRETVARHRFPKAGNLTISIGATRFRQGDDFNSLFKRADDALFQAKETGRNKAVVA